MVLTLCQIYPKLASNIFLKYITWVHTLIVDLTKNFKLYLCLKL